MAQFLQRLTDAIQQGHASVYLPAKELNTFFTNLDSHIIQNQCKKPNLLRSIYYKSIVDSYAQSLPDGDVQFLHHTLYDWNSSGLGVASVQNKPISINLNAKDVCDKIDNTENLALYGMTVWVQNSLHNSDTTVGSPQQAHELVHSLHDYIAQVNESYIYDISKGRLQKSLAKDKADYPNHYAATVANYPNEVATYFGLRF